MRIGLSPGYQAARRWDRRFRLAPKPGPGPSMFRLILLVCPKPEVAGVPVQRETERVRSLSVSAPPLPSLFEERLFFRRESIGKVDFRKISGSLA